MEWTYLYLGLPPLVAAVFAVVARRDVRRSARRIDALRAQTVGADAPRSQGAAIHARFAAFGGVDLPEVPRGPSRKPADFGA